MDNKQIAVNTLRVLSSECIDKANSGHPGIALGAAPIAFSLFADHLVFNPKNPKFDNRDRFVLSAGHASMLYYSLNYLFGLGLNKEDIMKVVRLWIKLKKWLLKTLVNYSIVNMQMFNHGLVLKLT